MTVHDKHTRPLLAIIEEYAEHAAWRCAYQSRFPWDPDCPCGLTAALRAAGLPVEWAAIHDPEETQ